jgi:MFS family permease
MTSSTSRGPRSSWLAFGALAVASCLTLLDQTQLTLALASIQRELHMPGSMVQLLVIGYAIAYAILLLPAGRLGDRFGHRRVLVIALLILMAGGLTAALAPDATVLVVARLVQGVGAGLLMPQVLGVLQSTFEPARRARPMAMLSSIMAVPIALAPSYGGALLAIAGGASHWRILFWTPIGADLLVLVAVLVLLPPGAAGRPRGFDVGGLLLLAPALAGLLLPLALVEQPGAPLIVAAIVFAAGAGVAVLFALHLRRRARHDRAPLVELSLLRIRDYRRGTIVAGLGYATSSASGVVLGLFLQQALHLPPLLAALCILPNAIGVGLSSWWVGRSATPASPRSIASGTAIAAAVLLVLSAAVLQPVPAVAIVCAAAGSAALGLANGMYTAPNQTRTLAEVPPVDGGSAASLMQLLQRIGTSIGAGGGLALYYAVDPRGGSAVGAAWALLFAALLISVAHLLTRGPARAARAATATDAPNL